MRVLNDWLKLPEAYDANFWQYNEFNINELAFHNHDGEKGDKLPSTSLTQEKDSVTTDTFDATRQWYWTDKDMPAGYSFDDTTITFFDSNGKRVFLDYRKESDTSYRVWSTLNATYEVRYA